jgi:hypothetical protein
VSPDPFANVLPGALFYPFVAYVTDVLLHFLKKGLLKIEYFRFSGHDGFFSGIITPNFLNCKNKVRTKFVLATAWILEQNRTKGGGP